MTATSPNDTSRADTRAGRRVYHLISADSHVNEASSLWVDRLPAEFQERSPRVERFEQGDAWVLEGLDGPMPVGLNAAAGQDPRMRQTWVRFDEIRQGGWNPAIRIEEIDRGGVDAEVLYPTPRLAQYMYATTDVDFHVAMVRAYNDWIDEYASHDLTRFRALPILPNRGQEHALAEIERVGGRASTGGFLLGAYPGGTLAPEPEDDVVFGALVERNLPMHVHVSMTTTMPFTINKVALPAGNGASRVVNTADQLTNLIFTGVFERFPDLMTVWGEVDCGWVPYIKEQMDDGFLRYRFRYDLPMLPSEYIERHAYFTYVSDMVGIQSRHRIGVEHILWSSDYPHGNSNYPEVWPAVTNSMGGVPSDERQLILAGNAARIYGFGKA